MIRSPLIGRRGCEERVANPTPREWATSGWRGDRDASDAAGSGCGNRRSHVLSRGHRGACDRVGRRHHEHDRAHGDADRALVAEQVPIRVMLVDDYDLVRAGVRAVVATQPDMTVVAEATSAGEAVAMAEATRPDVVMMDIRLGDGSGIEVTRDLVARLPETRVIMLTAMEDDDALFAAINAGAAGYLLKAVPNADLVQAIRTVANGGSTLDSVVIGPVLAELRRHRAVERDEKLARLSNQEVRVLALIAAGRTNRDIAAEIHLAEKTVKNYVSSVLAKLGVQRRAEAAA